MFSSEQKNPIPKSIYQLAIKAVLQFDLIEPGDRIAVAMSGGKDSLLLATLFREFSKRDDLEFEFVGLHLDQHQPGFDRASFDTAVEMLNVPLVVVSEDTHSVVQSKLKPGQIPCAICGRMRRGILNRWCSENGFNKLALGHHLDDAVETFFLNLFYGGTLDPLKPATPSRVEVTAIRPLILVEESKISSWAEKSNLPIVDCPVCDSFPESRRRDLKKLIADFETLNTDVHQSVRNALYLNRQPVEPTI